MRACTMTLAIVAIGGLLSAGGAAEPAPVPDNTGSAETHRVSAVAVGGWFSCALTVAGGVKCWGYNDSGLGDGTFGEQRTPVDVAGLPSGVTAIASGRFHACALTDGGSLKCWGSNDYGQLGDGTTSPRPMPVDVVGLADDVAAVTAGGQHTCALTDAGGVACWGENYSGQLGDGTTAERHTPVDVVGLTSGVAAVSAGQDHTCAVTDTGGVKCWGRNVVGQLGDGTTTDRHTPVDVVGLTSGVAAVSAGFEHTCVLADAGGVKCWGDNDRGQLGDGTRERRLSPVDVVGLIAEGAGVSAGWEHTCAVTGTGRVKCWGDNHYGQLGDGTTTRQHRQPVPVKQLATTVAVDANCSWGSHTCAVTATGAARCWGDNVQGQLGDGSTRTRLVPTTVWGLTGRLTGTFRPDLMTALHRDGPYRGDDIYNTTGNRQSRRIRLPRGEHVPVYVRIQNDGSAHDVVFLRGAGSASQNATYFHGDTSITRSVRKGLSWTPLRAGRATNLRMVLSADAHAKLGQYLLHLPVSSANNPARRDYLTLTVTITRA